MGHSIFAMCDRFLGLTGLAAALVVLSAVPAAFQYGLWDSNPHERCRRLELLLLTIKLTVWPDSFVGPGLVLVTQPAFW